MWKRPLYVLLVAVLGVGCHQSAPSDKVAATPSSRIHIVLASEDVGADSRACTPIWACMEPCYTNYEADGILIDERCAQAIEEAPCPDHLLDHPPWQDVCFPKCDRAEVHCNQDGTVTICSPYLNGGSDLRWMSFSCDTICDEMADDNGDHLHYAGKCSNTVTRYDEEQACQCAHK